MAITYHAGRRIQGLERVGSTLTDVDSPWTFANAQGSVSSGAVSFDYNQSTTDRGYHDLGANASGIWVFRFRLNITNKGNPSASNYLCKFGLGDNTNAMSTSQGGIFLTLNHGSSYTRFGGFSSYNQTNQGGNWGSNSPSTYDYSTSTNYYVEVARTGTTTATVKVFTNANYTDNLVFTCTLSSVNASLNVRYVKITTDSYGDQGSNRYNGTMDQMKFYDGITSVVATAGDVKPTNIQVGSRFEETDTRKMYHYTDIGITGSDVSLSELKAYYKFDESSGNIINEASTVGSTHSLGTNADLSINGSPSRDQTGSPANLGNSILFADPSEYGDAGTSTSQFNFMHNQSAIFTFAVWIKFPSAIEHNDCIFDDNIIGDVQVGCNICLRNTNAMRFIVANGTGNAPTINAQTSNGFVPTDNAFHFYVFRWDYSQSTGTLLISVDNGTPESFNKTSNTASNSNAGQVARFCSDTWAGSESLSGNILELSIWNRILTNAELTTLYNSGSGKIIATDPSWKELGT